MRTYSITDAARLLGVSAATVSRRLPAARASRGRSAHLSVQEVTEIAAAIHMDPESVRRRVDLADAFGSDMPIEAIQWATVAAERNLDDALEAHRARIPDDLLQLAQALTEHDELPEPWGQPGGWAPITAPGQLDGLLPPLDR